MKSICNICGIWKGRRIRWSVSSVFILAELLVLTVTVAFILFVFTRSYRQSMEEHAATSSEQSVVHVQSTLEHYTAEMIRLQSLVVEALAKDGMYAALPEAPAGSLGGAARETSSETDSFLTNLVQVRQDVAAITTYDRNGALLRCWTNDLTLKKVRYKNLSYTAPQEGESSGVLLVSPPHVASIFESSYPWVVTVYKNMTDATGEPIQVAIDLRFSNIANYIDQTGIGSHGYCYLINEKGDMMYHPQQQLIYAGLKPEESADLPEGTTIRKDVIYTVKTLDRVDWKIVGVCYVDEMITAETGVMIRTLCILFPGIFLVAIILGVLFADRLSGPLHRLSAAMSDFEKRGEQFSFSAVGGAKEISDLSHSFSHMVERIKGLMDQVRREEVSLRKTELKALQAQINPHFLYNTLDSIAWLCEEKNSEGAAEMVTALARLFRISISKGHELIPIGKEIEHAKSYLWIEKFRYDDRFTYHFEVDERATAFYCNKITLQPIIENAIYHGVTRSVDEGEIYIRVYCDGDTVVFEVEDNGVGMSPEQLRDIMSREPSDKTGIGVKNVNDRIRIYFGDAYGVTIESEPDEGTRVTIRMPQVKEANEYEK